MTKLLYGLEVSIHNDNEKEASFYFNGCFEGYRNTVMRAVKLSDAIAPKKTIIKITKLKEIGESK